jgi:uncharacterized protein (TIGR02996 family)
MTELENLHRAILLDPDDDLARLAYADLLEEDGNHDRAKYIRLMVAAVKLQCRHSEDTSHASSSFSESCMSCALRKEAVALVMSVCGSVAVAAAGGGSRSTAAAHRALFDIPITGSSAVSYQLSRGFVCEVRSTLQEFEVSVADLFRRQPVTSLVLSDRRAFHLPAVYQSRQVRNSDVYEWHRTVHTDIDYAGLPAEFFHGVPPGIQRRVQFGDEDKARQWLSKTAVNYGRRLADLPALYTGLKEC